MLSAIAGLSGDYAKAKTAHDVALGRLSSESNVAQEDLLSVRKEIAASKKAFGLEAEAHAVETMKARKEHSVLLASMRDEIACEQSKLDQISGAIKKITGIAG